jgi:hypothetical protein
MPLLPLTQKLLLKRKKTIQHDEWGLNSLSTNLTESRQQTPAYPSTILTIRLTNYIRYRGRIFPFTFERDNL